MSKVPQDLKYTKEHEWVRMEGGVAAIGITDHAQGALGDIVFVELPKVGTPTVCMKSFGTVESVKAASDLFSPLSGTVAAVNDKLSQSPEEINKEPYGAGWMIKIQSSNPKELDQLLDAAAYQKLAQSPRADVKQKAAAELARLPK
jgi:glycine cleavage system H protein